MINDKVGVDNSDNNSDTSNKNTKYFRDDSLFG